MGDRAIVTGWRHGLSGEPALIPPESNDSAVNDSVSTHPLTNHIQHILTKTPLPEDVTAVVFDMDALNFS